jgi:hypothetical protein
MGVQKIYRRLNVAIMKIIFLGFFLIAFSPQCLFSQKDKTVNFTNTLELFLKFESKVQEIRAKNKSDNVFISPADEPVIFENTLNEQAPDLITNTHLYYRFLVEILLDKLIKKNPEFNLDIVRILYHLCIDEYVSAAERIYQGYLQQKVDLEVLFNCLITSEDHYSNIVVLNYQSKKLQLFLGEILSNDELVKNMEVNYQYFSSSIKMIISGELYNAFQTDEKDWFFEIPIRRCI